VITAAGKQSVKCCRRRSRDRRAAVVKNLRRHQVKILRGAKPTGLQVEQPTKFDLVINLIAAKVLGIDVPAGLRARADEVIELARPMSASGTFETCRQTLKM